MTTAQQAAIDIVLRSRDEATAGIERSLGRIAGAFRATLGALGAFEVGRMAAAFLSDATREAVEAERATLKLEAVLRATGNAAGVSASDVRRYAGELETLTGVEADLIVDAQAVLATFKNVRGEAFQRTTQAALDLSAVFGNELRGSVTMLGKALEDPVRGLTALRRVGVSFSEAQQEQIKRLVESNRLFEAQAAILREVEAQVGGAAAAMQGPLSRGISQITNDWKNFKEEVGGELGRSGFFDYLGERLRTLQEDARRLVGIFRVFGQIIAHPIDYVTGRTAELEAAQAMPPDPWMVRRPAGRVPLPTRGPSAADTKFADEQARMRLDEMVASMRDFRDTLADVRAVELAAADAAREFADEQARMRFLETAALMSDFVDTLADVKAAEDALIERDRALFDDQARMRLAETAALMGDFGDTVADVKAAEDALIERDRALFDDQARMRLAETAALMSDFGDTVADINAGTMSTREHWENELRLANGFFDTLDARMQLWALDSQTAWRDVGLTVADAFQGALSGMSRAVGQAIVYGRSLSEVFSAVLKEVAAQTIGTLVQIGVQALVSSFVAKSAELSTMTTAAAANTAMAATAGAAWGALVGGPVGAAASGAASAKATMAAGVTGFLEALGLFGGLAAAGGVAHGGLDYVPRESTYLLQRGEMVLAPRQGERLRQFLDGDAGGRGRASSVVVLELNGRELGRALVDLARDGRLGLVPA